MTKLTYFTVKEEITGPYRLSLFLPLVVVSTDCKLFDRGVQASI
jgi:hypothetical protein